jgi:hypothetical protein
MHTKAAFGTDAEQIIRAALLVMSLAAVWWAVMLLIGWYNPEMHMLATASSALMASTGNGHGVVGRIIR